MTLQQLRYIVEVYKTGSITKSATNLFMSQPNLSNALKELETEIGMTIFVRTAAGVVPTKEGEKFILYAQSILSQADRMEFIFKNQKNNAVTIKIACVRSSYIAKTLSDFYNSIAKDVAVNIQLMETTSMKVLEAVANSNADIGRISYSDKNGYIYNNFARKNRLVMEYLWKGKSNIIVSKNSPLAKEEELTVDMLKGYTRIYYNDVEFDIMGYDEIPRIIGVNERATMMDFIKSSTDCYLWTISTHPDILETHNLVVKQCKDAPTMTESVVYHKDKVKTKEMQDMIEKFKKMRYAESFHKQEAFEQETVDKYL